MHIIIKVRIIFTMHKILIRPSVEMSKTSKAPGQADKNAQSSETHCEMHRLTFPLLFLFILCSFVCKYPVFFTYSAAAVTRLPNYTRGITPAPAFRRQWSLHAQHQRRKTRNSAHESGEKARNSDPRAWRVIFGDPARVHLWNVE